MRRYTRQGPAFRNYSNVPPTPSAPPTSTSSRVLPIVLRHSDNPHRLQKTLHGYGAPHRAQPSVRTFMSAASEQETQIPSNPVMCRQHTQPITNPPHPLTINPPLTLTLGMAPSIMSSPNSNLPHTYKQDVMRDRPATLLSGHDSIPPCRLERHPLVPFITALRLPNADTDLGTTLEHALGRGIKTPLVLAAPRSTIDIGRAVDPSSRTVDLYIITCHYSTTPLELTSF
jgi:hypothetical protein